MSTTFLSMLEQAGVDLAAAETVVVWLDDRAGLVSPADAPEWLSKVQVFDDYSDPAWNGQPTVSGERYGAQIWLPQSIVRTIVVDGIYELQWIYTTPTMLLRQLGLREIGR